MKAYLVTIVMILGLAFFYFASPILIPIFFSLFLAMLIDPIVSFFVGRGCRRQIVTYIIAFSIIVVLAGAAWVGVYAVQDLIRSVSKNPRVTELINYVSLHIGQVDSSFGGVQHLFKIDPSVQKVDVVDRYPIWVVGLRSAFGSLFEFASFALIVPMLLFYMLFEKDNLVESLNVILGRHLYLPTLNADLPNMVRTFVRANLITSLLLIFGQAIALFFLGFQNWLPLAIIVGILNVIPIVGAPAAVVLVIVAGDIGVATEFPFVSATACTLLLHTLLTSVVLPVLVGNRSNINTTTLIIGSLFWSWLWGGVGFLIAIPMTLLIKILLENNSSTIRFANLMAARPSVFSELDDTDI